MKINLQLAAIFLFLVLFYNKSLLAENVYVDLELVLAVDVSSSVDE